MDDPGMFQFCVFFVFQSRSLTLYWAHRANTSIANLRITCSRAPSGTQRNRRNGQPESLSFPRRQIPVTSFGRTSRCLLFSAQLRKRATALPWNIPHFRYLGWRVLVENVRVQPFEGDPLHTRSIWKKRTCFWMCLAPTCSGGEESGFSGPEPNPPPCRDPKTTHCSPEPPLEDPTPQWDPAPQWDPFWQVQGGLKMSRVASETQHRVRGWRPTHRLDDQKRISGNPGNAWIGFLGVLLLPSTICMCFHDRVLHTPLLSSPLLEETNHSRPRNPFRGGLRS